MTETFSGKAMTKTELSRRISILTVVAFSKVTSLDLHWRSLKFESYGEHKYGINCPGWLWCGLRFERADIALLTILTSITTTSLLWYKVRFVVLSSTHGRMLLRAVSAWGCCAHWSIASQVSFAALLWEDCNTVNTKKMVLTTAYSYLGVWQGKLLTRVANLWAHSIYQLVSKFTNILVLQYASISFDGCITKDWQNWKGIQ